MTSLVTELIDLARIQNVTVTEDTLSVDLSMGAQSLCHWHGIYGFCMVLLMSVTIGD